jgi:gentisate 1,2-dioxygenase
MLGTMKQDESPYYANLRDLNLSPGWARPEPSMWAAPQPKFKPAVWRFAQARQALDASHNLVPADQTERRNLIMVNPIEGNSYATTRHLVAAYQCVMPGDRARTHRHSAAALRLVLHGTTGVYTIVNGTRIDMLPGEVLLTPSWCWHGHANETGETGYWIDFLDIPFIQLTEAMFFEPYPQGGLEEITSTGPTPMRIPAREALGPGADAKTVEIGKGVMPTIALNLIRQPKGGRVEMPKSTTNIIYAVVLGKARFIAEGFDETAAVGDVVAMPSWHAHTIEAPETTVVFKVSDDPIFEKLGLARTAAN